MPVCPKCKSENIEVVERGFKLGRAVVTGIVFTPIVGVVAGAIGRRNPANKCKDCGKIFKIEDNGNNI